MGIALFPFDLPTTDYSLDFTKILVLVPIPFRARLAVSLFPACATALCNQHRGKQRIGIFPRSEGENALNRRAQYECMGYGGECENRLSAKRPSVYGPKGMGRGILTIGI